MSSYKRISVLFTLSALLVCLLILLPNPAFADTLTLQPNVTVGKDTYLVSGSPSQNFGVSADLNIKGDDNRRTLMEFNLSSISSDARVISAVLKLFVISADLQPNPAVNIYRINRSWTEGTGDGDVTANGATWNAYNGTASWTTNGGDFDSKVWANTTISSENVWYEWNITDLVRNLANQTYSNNGVLIRTTTVNSGTTTFASSDNTNTTIRPILEIGYCTPNLVNTSWSSWNNILCAGNQMNQSRSRVQYDSNSCGNIANQTFYEYQLVGPVYANTSWSSWQNILCLSNDRMNQSRSLTQYDSYSCVANLTVTEYRATESCDFCTPNLMNTSWSTWQDVTACRINNTISQERSNTQYDSNLCGEIANQTNTEYQEISCDYCTENITGPFDTACVSNQLTRYYTDVNYAACCAVTGLSSDCRISNRTYDNQTLTCGETPSAPASSSSGGGGGGGSSSNLVYIRGNKNSAVAAVSVPEKIETPAKQVEVKNPEASVELAVTAQPQTFMQGFAGLSVAQVEFGKGAEFVLDGILIFLIIIFAGATVKNGELFYIPMLIADIFKPSKNTKIRNTKIKCSHTQNIHKH